MLALALAPPVPVTVTVTYADGRSVDTIVPVTEATVERRIPVEGPVKQVRFNRDGAALAVFRRQELQRRRPDHDRPSLN